MTKKSYNGIFFSYKKEENPAILAICKFIYFIYLFLAVLGVRCWAWALSSCGERGLVSATVHGLLTVVASPVAEHRLQARGPQQLWPAGSVAVAHGPSRSSACGILADQGPNPCPPHWQAASQPLRHQGSPILAIWMNLECTVLSEINQTE